MVKLRRDFETKEVLARVQPEEIVLLTKQLCDDASILPTVPHFMMSFGEAAKEADALCLNAFDRNAKARASSMIVAGNSHVL